MTIKTYIAIPRGSTDDLPLLVEGTGVEDARDIIKKYRKAMGREDSAVMILPAIKITRAYLEAEPPRNP